MKKAPEALKEWPRSADRQRAWEGHKEGEPDMTCPVCRRNELVEINLQLRGSRVTMHSCSGCEARWWDREGEKVGLGQVLNLTVPA
jgi:hypothetical protein